MSNRSRVGLVVAAAIVAVVAFLALKPDEGSEEADNPATVETATTPSAPAPPERIDLRAGAPRGGPARIEAAKGDIVRFVVSSDRDDDIHLHGYDIEKVAAPGRPARFRVKADLEGVFEIESHTAEDAGREPLIARLVVEP